MCNQSVRSKMTRATGIRVSRQMRGLQKKCITTSWIKRVCVCVCVCVCVYIQKNHNIYLKQKSKLIFSIYIDI